MKVSPRHLAACATALSISLFCATSHAERNSSLAGQTVGLIHEVLPVAEIIGRTVDGFHAIRRQQGERSLAGGF